MAANPSSSCVLFSLFVVAILFVNCSFADYHRPSYIYLLERGDFSVSISDYGATVYQVTCPDKTGRLNDIVLGYGTMEEYKNDTTYFGGLIGRVANRIGGAKFTLNGTVYHLPANDHGNTLHGGDKGFSDVYWIVESYERTSHITLSYNGTDGEQGFPGNVSVTVTYMLTGANKLGIKMTAKVSGKATPVNLASHSYWNLGGHDSGDILSHKIQLFASKITPVDDKLIPTGEITPVQGTPYDFLQPRTIGSDFSQIPNGYDINYVVDQTGSRHLHKVAIVQEPRSGRKMELWSNKPGVQFYTGNMLNDTVGKEGFTYRKYAGLCLETQGFPDSVNHPNFPSQIVNPGETYEHIMLYRFTTS